MTYLILPLLQVNVTEKLKVAPDSSYQLGLLIGSFLPFLLLAGIAYWMYYRAKKGSEKE
jgi:hypothetical protein